MTALVSQLVTVAQQAQSGEAGGKSSLEAIRNLLWGCKVQQYVLLSLSASMYACQRAEVPDQNTVHEEEQGDEGGEISEESLVQFGKDGSWAEHPLQIALLKLLKVLIMLEHCVSPPQAKAQGSNNHILQSRGDTPSSALAREWQTAMMYQQSIKAVRYVASQPITAQGMFVSAAARALCPQFGFAMHPAWVSLLCRALPFLGRSLAIIVAPILAQICRNLDELVKQHEHDGIKGSHRYCFFFFYIHHTDQICSSVFRSQFYHLLSSFTGKKNNLKSIIRYIMYIENITILHFLPYLTPRPRPKIQIAVCLDQYCKFDLNAINFYTFTFL